MRQVVAVEAAELSLEGHIERLIVSTGGQASRALSTFLTTCQ